MNNRNQDEPHPREVSELTHFQKRVLQDAMQRASATYWRKRAAQLRRAMPRPGDFLGLTPDPAADQARVARMQADIDYYEARAAAFDDAADAHARELS
jgi:hypothetical protein